ncbi:MAG: M14 family zinc carboxypeptidase [Zestosphaera sp.]
MARKLSDPRTVHVDDAVQLARAGKPIVFLMGDQHSNEVDHSEAVMQFVYELATRNDAKTVDILNNVIIVFLPYS